MEVFLGGGEGVGDGCVSYRALFELGGFEGVVAHGAGLFEQHVFFYAVEAEHVTARSASGFVHEHMATRTDHC